MSAKPRVTVRLAPSTLHQLAYLSARHSTPPAEMVRSIVTAWTQAQLRDPGAQADWQAAYNAWLDEQAAKSGRAESPAQEDFDALVTARDPRRSEQRVMPAPGPGAYSSPVTPALPGIDLPPRTRQDDEPTMHGELDHLSWRGRKRH